MTSYDLGEYPCHPFLGSSQYYTVSHIGEFRNEYMCGEVTESRNNNEKQVGKHLDKLIQMEYNWLIHIIISDFF